MPLDNATIIDQHGKPARRAPDSAGKFRASLDAAQVSRGLNTGWDAGQLGRRLSAIPTSARAVNTLIRTYGQAVLARSRHLAANNAYAASAREAYVAGMVGSGIMPAPQIDDPKLKATINQAWEDWTAEADADWTTDFYGLQGIGAGELFEAGEFFVRFRQRRVEDGLLVPLQLQILPAEMLDLHWNLNLDNGRRIECGIEFDAIGRRVAYHFWTVFPGTDVYFGQPVGLRTRVPADQVLHIFRPIRAGQVRGIPHTLSMISTLALLDLYDDAELERKRTAALFGAFITRPDRTDEDHPLGPADDFLTPTGDVQPSPALEPGVTVDLGPGEDIKFAEPADVGSTYEAFQYRNLLRASAGAGIPYSDMTGDLRRTSFGSIRAGLIAHRRRIETLQQSVVIYQLCQRVYDRWMTEAVLAGALPITPADFAANQRAYRRADWIPPQWDWIDPLKDIEAQQLLVQNGFLSKSAVIKGMGRDPLVVATEIKQDRERDEALGNPSQSAAPPVPAPSTGGPSAAMPTRFTADRTEAPVPIPDPRPDRQNINITLAQAPSSAAARPPQTIRTSRDEHGNVTATLGESPPRSRLIRTSRDQEGNLTAVIEDVEAPLDMVEK